MDKESLLWMSFICAMGAISPGPSLVVVLRNTIVGGRSRGIMTAIGHGTGFSIYAFVAVMGLSSVLLANDKVFYLLQGTGALFLIWLAFKMITHKKSVSCLIMFVKNYKYDNVDLKLNKKEKIQKKCIQRFFRRFYDSFFQS